MLAVFVIPTYNEKENIKELIPQIFSVLKKENTEGMVIVVDDNSPDNTARAVKELSKKYNIELIRRPGKLGLGSAYKDGFDAALRAKADVIFQIDADLSHNPKDIPKFLRAIKNYDVVIGSRKIPGGENPKMSLLRKTVSAAGNLLARNFLGLNPKDCTSGFRAIRTEALQKTSYRAMSAKGYVFLVELIYNLIKNGATVTEIPIRFDERLLGRSKLRADDIKEFALTIFKLKFLSDDENWKKFKYNEKEKWDKYWVDEKRNLSTKKRFIKWFRLTFFAPEVAKHVNEFFPSEGLFLEAGSGSSDTSRKIKKLKRTFISLDFSYHALVHAGTVDNVDYLLQGNVLSIPIKSGTIDGIWNVGVMEHFRRSDVEKIVKEFSRVLRRNGKILIFWPSAKLPVSKAINTTEEILRREIIPLSVWDPTRDDIEKIMKASGLKEINIKTSPTLMHFLAFGAKA